MPESVALITGATGGLGRALVAEARARGFRAIEVGRNLAVGPNAIQADFVEDPFACEVICEGLRERSISGIDLLINNAGVALMSPLRDTFAREIQVLFAVNCSAPANLVNALWPLLATRRGRVINIGSIASRLTVPTLATYSASKKCLIALTDGIRIEGATDGIQAGYVELGNVATGLHAKVREAARKKPASLEIGYFLERSRELEAKSLSPSAAAQRIISSSLRPRVRRISLIGQDAYLRYWMTLLLPHGVLERKLTKIYSKAIAGRL